MATAGDEEAEMDALIEEIERVMESESGSGGATFGSLRTDEEVRNRAGGRVVARLNAAKIRKIVSYKCPTGLLIEGQDDHVIIMLRDPSKRVRRKQKGRENRMKRKTDHTERKEERVKTHAEKMEEEQEEIERLRREGFYSGVDKPEESDSSSAPPPGSDDDSSAPPPDSDDDSSAPPPDSDDSSAPPPDSDDDSSAPPPDSDDSEGSSDPPPPDSDDESGSAPLPPDSDDESAPAPPDSDEDGSAPPAPDDSEDEGPKEEAEEGEGAEEGKKSKKEKKEKKEKKDKDSPKKDAEAKKKKTPPKKKVEDMEAWEVVLEKRKNVPTGEDKKYTYDELRVSKSKLTREDINVMKRETYLSDEEFQEVLGMSRDEFEALAMWKKAKLKSENDLF